MRYVFKSETAGMGGPILAITILDLENATTYRFGETGLADGLAVLRAIAAKGDQIITHSDYHTKKLAQAHDVVFSDVFDTLVHVKDAFKEPRNGLGVWAGRLGLARGKTFADAEFWTPALQAHCDQDARIVAALYLHIIDHRTVGA